MPQNYTPEFKKKIVRIHLEEGRTMKSITAEFGVSKASISKRNMLMCNIIMCGHTAITDTRRPIRQGLPVKSGGSMLVDWIA